MGMCGPKGYDFWAVAVGNRVYILTILGWKSENRYGFERNRYSFKVWKWFKISE